MLVATGRVLEVDSRLVGQPGQQFESITVSLLTGKADIERVRLGRDFPTTAIPREGDEVALSVVVSTYQGRNGAQVQMTALADVTDALGAPALS